MDPRISPTMGQQTVSFHDVAAPSSSVELPQSSLRALLAEIKAKKGEGYDKEFQESAEKRAMYLALKAPMEQLLERDETGFTVLDRAAQLGLHRLVRLLLSIPGGYEATRSYYNMSTPLEIVQEVFKNHRDVLSYEEFASYVHIEMDLKSFEQRCSLNTKERKQEEKWMLSRTPLQRILFGESLYRLGTDEATLLDICNEMSPEELGACNDQGRTVFDEAFHSTKVRKLLPFLARKMRLEDLQRPRSRWGGKEVNALQHAVDQERMDVVFELLKRKDAQELLKDKEMRAFLFAAFHAEAHEALSSDIWNTIFSERQEKLKNYIEEREKDPQAFIEFLLHVAHTEDFSGLKKIDIPMRRRGFPVPGFFPNEYVPPIFRNCLLRFSVVMGVYLNALERACMEDQREEALAEIDKLSPEELAGQEKSTGYTALHMACARKWQEVAVGVVSKQEPSSFIKQDVWGYNALHKAASCGQREVVDVLLQRMDPAGLNMLTAKGETPLQLVQGLIQKGEEECKKEGLDLQDLRAIERLIQDTLNTVTTGTLPVARRVVSSAFPPSVAARAGAVRKKRQREGSLHIPRPALTGAFSSASVATSSISSSSSGTASVTAARLKTPLSLHEIRAKSPAALRAGLHVHSSCLRNSEEEAILYLGVVSSQVLGGQVGECAETALHIALRKGLYTAALRIGERMFKEDLLKTDVRGNNALHAAIEKGSVRVVKALLQKIDREGLEAKNKAGKTPLQLVQELIQKDGVLVSSLALEGSVRASVGALKDIEAAMQKKLNKEEASAADPDELVIDEE